MKTKPTKFYETEEGRFCDLCFNPEQARDLYLNTDLEVCDSFLEVCDSLFFNDNYEDVLLFHRNNHLEAKPVYQVNDRYSKVLYYEYPECECCGYIFKYAQVLKASVLAEKNMCCQCGSKKIIMTSLADYRWRTHYCAKCYSEPHYLALDSYRTFTKLYNSEHIVLEQLMVSNDKVLIKQCCKRLISYIEALHAIVDSGILDREYTFNKKHEIKLLEFIIAS